MGTDLKSRSLDSRACAIIEKPLTLCFIELETLCSRAGVRGGLVCNLADVADSTQARQEQSGEATHAAVWRKSRKSSFCQIGRGFGILAMLANFFLRLLQFFAISEGENVRNCFHSLKKHKLLIFLSQENVASWISQMAFQASDWCRGVFPLCSFH